MKVLPHIKLLIMLLALITLSLVELTGCANTTEGQSEATPAPSANLTVSESPTPAPSTPAPTPTPVPEKRRFDLTKLLRKTIMEIQLDYGDDAILSDEWYNGARYFELNTKIDGASVDGILMFTLDYDRLNLPPTGKEIIIEIGTHSHFDELSIGDIAADTTYNQFASLSNSVADGFITFDEYVDEPGIDPLSGAEIPRKYKLVNLHLENANVILEWDVANGTDVLDQACAVITIQNYMPQKALDLMVNYITQTKYVDILPVIKENKERSTDRTAWYDEYVPSESEGNPEDLVIYGGFEIDRRLETVTHYRFDYDRMDFINADIWYAEVEQQFFEDKAQKEAEELAQANSKDGYPITVGQTVYYSTIMSVSKGIVTAVSGSQVTVKFTGEYYNKSG